MKMMKEDIVYEKAAKLAAFHLGFLY